MSASNVPGNAPKQLRWSNTLARSGRLKDVSTVFEHHNPTPCQAPSRYEVRFHDGRERKKRKVVRRSQEPLSPGILPGLQGASSPSSSPSPYSLCTSSNATDIHVPPSSETSFRIRNDAFSVDGIETPSHLASLVPEHHIAEFVTPNVELDTEYFFDDNPISLSPDPVLSVDLPSTDPIDLATNLANTVVDSNDRAETETWSEDTSNVIGTYLSCPSRPRLEEFQDMGMSDACELQNFDICSLSLSTEFAGGDRQRYLQFFIEKCIPRFNPWWVGIDNPFLSVVIPASVESRVLMHAVCAISAGQAALASGQEEHTHKALWHKHNVTSQLRRNTADVPCLSTLIACVLVQTIEVLGFGTKNWHEWLQGALVIVQTRNQVVRDIREKSNWLAFTKCVVAMETLASVTANCEVSLSTRYWDSYLQCITTDHDPGLSEEDVTFDKCSKDKDFERLSGCPAIVMCVLAEMADHIQRANSKNMPATSTETAYYPTMLDKKRLQRWEELLMRPSSTCDDESRYHLMEAFRHAALVQFTRRVREIPYTSSIVQNHARLALQHIEGLDIGKLSVVGIWPMMIAGLELDEKDSPQLASALLQKINQTKALGGDEKMFSECESLVKLVWKERKESPTWEERSAVDWLKLSAQRGWTWCFW